MIPIISYTRRRGIHFHHRPSIRYIIVFLLAIITTILSVVAIYNSSLVDKEGDYENGGKCRTSLGTYQGDIYTKAGITQQNKCLIESPWMRVSQHTVKTTTTTTISGDGQTINDWLFIDYHDRINVLVESPPHNTSTPTNSMDKYDDEQESDERQFIIMEQTKYALDQTSLAIVGGLIEPSSDVGGAIDAAKREVLEELSIYCNNWKDLGRFRTDVNRGMGWVFPFLATDCTYATTSGSDIGNVDSSNSESSSNLVGARDTEKQHLRKMSLSEVKKEVMEGKFVEVQWSNTVALAMLHLSV